MQSNRLTTMNQFGDILYIGAYKNGDYRGIGDYSENLSNDATTEIITKLYYFEEYFEDLVERLEALNGKRDSN